MKKMRITSLLLALCMGVAMLSGCNAPVAEPEVEVIPVELSVSTADLELLVGESANIEYAVNPEDTAVTITCDNNEVAIVDASGKVVALAEGSATITVKVDEEVQETLTVKVSEPIVEIPDPVITLAERDVVKDVGDSFRLEYSLKNAEGMEVSFESENPEIAAVDEDGNVKVMDSGETAITITVGDVSAAVVVTAKAKVEEIAAVSSAAPPAPSSSSSAPASSAASSPASSAPASSSSASTVQTGSSGYVGAKDECYPVTEGGKHYVVMCNGWSSVGSAGSKSPVTTDTVTCYVCKVGVSSSGKIVSGGSSASGSASSQATTTIDTAAYAREIIRLTNEARIAAGLNELVVDSAGMSLAAIRAKELVELNSHQRPGGGWAANEGWGENMAIGQSSPQKAFDAWMASKGHRAAILDPDNVAIGAGCYRDGTLYWILLFSYE